MSRFAIGTIATATLRIDDPDVVIEVTHDEVLLIELGSKSGTETKLVAGDRIRVGATDVQLLI